MRRWRAGRRCGRGRKCVRWRRSLRLRKMCFSGKNCGQRNCRRSAESLAARGILFLHPNPFLMAFEHAFQQTFIYLAAAVVAVLVGKKLGLGAVLGYLVAGAAIGRWGFG